MSANRVALARMATGRIAEAVPVYEDLVARLVYAARLGLVEFWMATGKWPDCAEEMPYDFRGEGGRVQGVAKEGFGFLAGARGGVGRGLRGRGSGRCKWVQMGEQMAYDAGQ